MRLADLEATRPPSPSLLHPLGQNESAWAPLSLSSCGDATPAHYAPCLAQRLKNVVHAEELLYPDFELREPHFAREEHRRRWRAFVQSDPDFGDRAVFNKGWVKYRGQSGQNFVFRDVSYSTGSFGADSWAGTSCMSPYVSTSPIQPLTDSDEAAAALPTVYIALSPDAYSFQHFLDRVTHIIAQGAHLAAGAAGSAYVLTGREGTRAVQEMYARMGFPPERVLHLKPKVAAKEMIFSCRAVLIHPWLSLKTLELLGVRHKPVSVTRNKTVQVVYMSRSDGHTANPGRKVVNEEAVLHGIRSLLAERNRGEELVVFNPDDFRTVTELFAWFAESAIAIIGPHGGAMINHRWANPDILVIEFMPTTRIAVMIYEEASLLSQTYAALVVEPTVQGGLDMEIDVEDVRGLMRAHLGVVGSSPLRKSYPWQAKELGFRKR
ncbi:hypothetical protein B0H15DRAFT_777465 [Mycena belliarum]|uniref:Glycosyltransferase 61 catalytic domain-containing protein n=1 Tax=Mycena belliarum TaxID=1033014 RepID=A0AAD6XQM4_9AGAR|nr:hypothetical protein B0H15DRAFT_777465 [Mycena belliae]